MKKITGFILALVFSNSGFAVDNAVENIQALCGLAKQGKYSQIQGKAQIQADGSVKLASLGGKGEISFTKGDWDGMQRVLQAHQAGDNKDYRACVANSLPYFKSKVVTATPAAKSKNISNAKAVKKAQSLPQKQPTAAPAEKASTTCTIEGDQDVCGNTTGGDMNINFGSNSK